MLNVFGAKTTKCFKSDFPDVIKDCLCKLDE
jgi:hypothetical protein